MSTKKFPSRKSEFVTKRMSITLKRNDMERLISEGLAEKRKPYVQASWLLEQVLSKGLNKEGQGNG